MYVPTASVAGPAVSSVRWSFFWGLLEDDVGPPNAAACASDPNRFECLRCHGNGLTNLTLHTNIFFEALSVVTLGTVTPVTVSYQCAAPSPVSIALTKPTD